MTNENIKSPMHTDEAEVKELGAEELQGAAGGSFVGIVGPGDNVTDSIANGIEDVADATKHVVDAGAADVVKGAELVGDEASKVGSALESGLGDVAKGVWDNWC
ncbi:hypothetical protein [Martelella soudanensis]|uniref:hypothetical protein n=1 Tax=unclassified Martelella TaxID=2629616 RepID=UPI0015DEE31A|nr:MULTISPECIES: hypothetical protein [unclassified Martelella]